MRIAHDYPDDFEDRIEAMLDQADQLRKERREKALDVEVDAAVADDQDERHDV